MCDYFLKCENAATGTTAHPILGQVATCARCADRFGLDLIPFDVAADTD